MKITFEFATQDDCLDRMVPSDLRVLVAQRDKLQARVAELVAVAVSVRDDLLLRSEIDSDGTRCVNLSASKWSSFCDVIDDNNSGAFILRKQAEAVEYEIISLCGDLRKSGYRGISVKELLHESVSRSSKIRNKAKKFDDQ